MELAKIRSWSDEELKTQETQSSEQLFRIRFQAKLGQNEGIKKLRELRKDIARIQTIARERSLGIRAEVAPAAASGKIKSASTKSASTKSGTTKSAKGSR